MDFGNHLGLLPETHFYVLRTKITPGFLFCFVFNSLSQIHPGPLSRRPTEQERIKSKERSPRRIPKWYGQDSLLLLTWLRRTVPSGRHANSWRRSCGRSPEKEEIGVVLDHGVGVTREVAQAREVESGARGHLEHAAPRLVAQHLDLGRVEEPRVAGLVLPRQVVVQAVHLLVKRQHLGVHDDLGQLRAAALAQRSPLGGQLAAAGGSEPAGQAEGREQQRAQHAGGGSGRRARPGSALRPGRTSPGAWRGLPGLAGQRGAARPPGAGGVEEPGAPAPGDSAAPPAGEAQPWALGSERRSLNRRAYGAWPSPAKL